MAVVITAEIWGAGTPRAVLVTVTGLVGVTSFNLYRQAAGEAQERLRGGYSVTPTGNAYVVADVTPPLGRPIIYTVETFAGGNPVGAQVSAAPVTVPDVPGFHVLSNPVTGDSVLVQLVADDDARTNDISASTFHPSGRSDAVVVYDVRQDDAGQLTLYTPSRQAALALVDLLASGAPLASRHPNDGCDVAAVEYLWFGATGRKRRTRPGDRLHTLPFVTVANPDPDITPNLVSLRDIANYYGPAGNLRDIAGGAGGTLLDIARGTYGAV